MKNNTFNCKLLGFLVLPVFFVLSCATKTSAIKPAVNVNTAVSVLPVNTIIPPEKPEAGLIPEHIMGQGVIGAGIMAEFLLVINPNAERDFVSSLAEHYANEAAIEGINHDVAFSQMCLETGFLKYGGLVTLDMNNFCGLGAIGPKQPGLSFPDASTGVRAHIQHLKAYASEEPLKQELVDPRYRYVRLGSSPMIKGLAGTWAADPEYAAKIRGILKRLYTFYSENL